MAAHLRHLAHLALDVVDSVLLDRSAVELVEVLSRGSHVDVEHVDLHIRVLVPDQHGVLCRVHTADFGTVGLALAGQIAGAHALDEGHGLGGLVVGEALQMALGGAGRIGQALELQGGDHIRALVVGILVELVQLNGVKAGRYHNGAVLSGNNLVLLLVVDGARRAHLLTDAAFSGLELDAMLTVDHRHVGDGLGEGGVDGASGG